MAELVDIESLLDGFGEVNLFTASRVAKDPWAFGPQCWILENPRPLDVPVPATGQQGLWDAPSELEF